MDFKTTLSLCLFSIASFFASQLYATPKPATVCDQIYALCTSAPCIPDPKNQGATICKCAVHEGNSAGFSTCEQRKPFTDQYKAQHVVSTFSFEQLATKKSLSCPKGMPWSNCVDMPCTIDPQNKDSAICTCKIDNKHAFFTFGGNCEKNTCNTGFWSGAIAGTASDALREALSKIEGNPTPMTCTINK